ncbi:tyrosine-type recombinase/integrase [Kitasatospora arboriphila]
MADAADNGLRDSNPVRPRNRGRGRTEPRTERVWATEYEVNEIARRILTLAGPNQALLVITAAYTGMRWGELASLRRERCRTGAPNPCIIIDPEVGALHEVNGELSYGQPKTASSARTVTLPPFLASLLAAELARTSTPPVFTTIRGKHLRRSGFQRRVWAPAVNGTTLPDGTVWKPIKPGLTFHGLRHSHKTWMIEDGIPGVAQARRLGHRLQDKIDDVYSHVAASVEQRLLAALEARWQRALRPAAEVSPE